MRYVTFILCIAVGQVANAQSSSKSDELIGQWNALEEYERSEWIGKLTSATLQQLKTEGDASLAVQANWKLITDSLHSLRVNQRIATDERRLSYFLGFLEGRANIEAPPWWSKTFLTSIAMEKSVLPAKLEIPKTFKPIGQAKSVRDIHASKQGESYELEFDGKKFTLPPSMRLISTPGVYEDMDCIVEGKFVYVSVGESYMSDKHQVCCIETQTNKMMWQSVTCPGYAVGPRGGGVDLRVNGIYDGYHEMRMFSSNRLFVFNISSVGYFIHGFDATNGKTIFQFSDAFSP